MTTELWQEFAEQASSNLLTNNTPFSVQTTESLETTWHKIQTSIIQAALSKIPNKKFTTKNFHHTFSSKATELHLDLKLLGEAIKHAKKYLNNPSISYPDLSITIYNINSRHSFNIPLLPSNPNSILNWISIVKDCWKSLYNARNLENTYQIREHINQAINKRCDFLQTKPTKMINSILDRYSESVHFNNIKTQDGIITEPTEIKSAIQQHFHQWTAHYNLNQIIFNSDWNNEYKPSSKIKSKWYDPVLAEINTEEVYKTLSNLSNNKACGPSGISYEMIKHSGLNTIQAITALLN